MGRSGKEKLSGPERAVRETKVYSPTLSIGNPVPRPVKLFSNIKEEDIYTNESRKS